MLKYLEKTFKIVTNILTIIAALLVLLILIGRFQTDILKQSHSNIFNFTIFKIATGSMEPKLKVDDIVLVNITKNIKKDDIVTFKSNGNFITHRVISIDNDTVITKGDNNNTNDIPINRSDIVGVVKNVFTGFSLWQKIFTTPSVVISLFVTLLLFDFAFSYKQKKKEEAEVEEIKEEIKTIKKEDIPPKIEDFLPKGVNKEIFNNYNKKEKKVYILDLDKIEEKDIEFLENTMQINLEEISKKQDDKKIILDDKNYKEEIEMLENTIRINLEDINKKIIESKSKKVDKEKKNAKKNK